MKFLKNSFRRHKSNSSAMGCGASNSGGSQKTVNGQLSSDRVTNTTNNTMEQKNGHANHEANTLANTSSTKPTIDTNANIPQQSDDATQLTNNSRESLNIFTSVPKPVAFDVSLVEQKADDSIIKKYPPKRLMRLEAPPQLKESEVRLEGRVQSAEERKLEIVKRLESAGKSRERQQAVIVAKQQLREERAKRARQKAQKLNVMNPDDFTFDVEKDPAFNSYDDEEDWLETNPEEISKWPIYKDENNLASVKPPHYLRRQKNNQYENIGDDRDEFFDV